MPSPQLLGKSQDNNRIQTGIKTLNISLLIGILFVNLRLPSL